MKLKSKIAKGLLVSALSLATIIPIGYTGIGLIKSSAKTVSLQSEEIESTYFVGEQFSVPDSVNVTIDGQTVSTSNAFLRFPDGTIREKGTYTLQDMGTYSVVYSFEHNGQKYKAEQSFNVSEYKFEFNNDALIADCGDLTMSATGEKGLTISLSEGDEFTFKAPFNINDTENGWADICRLYPVPVEDEENIPECTKHGTTECRTARDSVKFFVVKVIDCYDPDTYFEVLVNNNLKSYYNASETCGGLYSAARSSANENWYGLRASTTAANLIEYEGNTYIKDNYTLDKIHDCYGSATWGTTNFKEFAEQGGFNFSYNEQTKQVKFNSSLRPEESNLMINDFDSAAINGEDLFEGFTTGEVYVSIYCYDYRKDAPQQIEIASLLGVEGEALYNLITEDSTAPLIVSNDGLNSGDALYVAKNEVFSMPEVTTYDVNFKDLSVSCYTNYGTANQSVVYMNGNKFTPTQNVMYTLVYTAADSYGNVSEFILNLYSVDKKSLVFDEIDVQKISINNGVCKLPNVSVTGLNGNVDTEIYVVDPTGKRFLVTDYAFDIKQSGTYGLEYVFSDGIYTASTETTFVNDSEEVLFLDDIDLNKYYIKSNKYSIEDYFGYVYSAEGLKAVLCDVFVSSDGGEFIKISDSDRLGYTVTASETLQFKYKYGENEKLSDVAKVVDVNYGENIDYTKYFVTPFTVAKGEQNFTFSADRDGTIEFVNPVSIPDFSLEFEFDAERLNFTILNVYLKDYYSNQSVKISFKKNAENKLLFAFNDGEFASAGIDFCSAYKIFYQGGKILTNLGDNVSYDLTGFNAKIAYLTLEFVEVDGDSSLLLKKIGNQVFREGMKESGSVFITEQTSTLFDLNDTYVIQVPTVNNVLFPVLNNKVFVTVVDDNGDYVEDVDGNLLDSFPITEEHTIKLTTAGIYVVKYTVIVNGSTKNITTTSKPIALNVSDNIPPEIWFNDGIDEYHVVTVKAGEAHQILSYTISDNNPNGELKVRIGIYNDRNALLDYGELTEYVFKKAGTYTIKVVCFDEDGNQARASYTVVVK